MCLYKTDARRWHSFISEDHYQTGNMLKHNLSHTRLMRIGQVLMITYLEQKYINVKIIRFIKLKKNIFLFNVTNLQSKNRKSELFEPVSPKVHIITY